VQARTEASLYHDDLGRHTTSLSLEAQSSGAGRAAPDVLYVGRADLRRKGTPAHGHKLTAGAMVARLTEAGNPARGPVALGLRAQHSARLAPALECDATIARVAVLGSGAADAAAAAAALGAPPPGPGEDAALAANFELRTNLQPLLGCRHPAPLSISANAMRFRRETMAAAGAAMQYKTRSKDVWSAKLQARVWCRDRRRELSLGRALPHLSCTHARRPPLLMPPRLPSASLPTQVGAGGRAGLNVKYKSGTKEWLALLALLPLGAAIAERLGWQK
jgi:hypothetical protein